MPVRALLPAVIDQIDEWHSNPDKLRGLPTGFTDFDKMTGGLRPGDLVIVAGRPSMGKTTLAVNMAEYAARAPGNACLGGHLQHGNAVRAGRSRACCPRSAACRFTSLRSGNISDEDWVRITERHQPAVGSEDLHRRDSGAESRPNCAPARGA